MKWIKSSYCNFANCLEVTDLGHSIAVRNSKARDCGTLYFTRTEWAEFLQGVRAGEFDLDCIDLAPDGETPR